MYICVYIYSINIYTVHIFYIRIENIYIYTMCIYIYTYISIYIHIHTHTHTHTYVYIFIHIYNIYTCSAIAYTAAPRRPHAAASFSPPERDPPTPAGRFAEAEALWSMLSCAAGAELSSSVFVLLY